jgi:hypothetical protein
VLVAGWAVASVCVDGEESGSYEWNAGSLRTEADSLGTRQTA